MQWWDYWHAPSPYNAKKLVWKKKKKSICYMIPIIWYPGKCKTVNGKALSHYQDWTSRWSRDIFRVLKWFYVLWWIHKIKHLLVPIKSSQDIQCTSMWVNEGWRIPRWKGECDRQMLIFYTCGKKPLMKKVWGEGAQITNRPYIPMSRTMRKKKQPLQIVRTDYCNTSFTEFS